MRQPYTSSKTFILIILCLILSLSNAAKAQKVVYPNKGEGLSQFFIRSGIKSKELKEKFYEINKRKLGKKKILKLGVGYTIPSIPKAPLVKKILGKKHKQIKIKSDDLKGASFFLVSGHGGPDPGAVYKKGRLRLHEDEYAYDIILRLARYLWSHQAKVEVIIRDPKDGIRDDKHLKNSKRERCLNERIPLNQVARLDQRCKAVNKLFRKDHSKYKRAIFLHVDSRQRKNRMDVFFYYYPKGYKGKALAKTIQKTFIQKYNKFQPNRGFSGTVEGRDLYVLRNTLPASVFVEVGNIQNLQDQKRLVISDNREALAKWIGDAIIKDYKKRK